MFSPIKKATQVWVASDFEKFELLLRFVNRLRGLQAPSPAHDLLFCFG